MIIVRIVGGLGNQMFQYAFGLALSQRLNTKLILDENDFVLYKLRQFQLNKFPVNLNLINDSLSKIFRVDRQKNIFQKVYYTILKRILGYTYCKEPFHKFWKESSQIKDKTYLEGFWQSEKYFDNIAHTISECFRYNNKNAKALDYLKIIKETESVFLHVRRGDYVSDINANKVHGTCSEEYYNKALSFFQGRSSNYTYFVFSDDISYVREYMFLELKNKIFIELNSDCEDIDLEELALMYNCKHAIIANSTFSWWGAWLINNDNKIIAAPIKWFSEDNETDLIPNTWIRF